MHGAGKKEHVIGYPVIDTPEGLAEASNRLARAEGPVAVDVERASGFRYSARAYLVQVFRRDAGVFLFDPPAIGDDFTPLQNAIGDADWVFHAASQDLPSLAEIGLVPRRILDTELSARLLGWDRVGLAAVVERTLGIVLKKEHSAADWSTRPLPQSWLEYAALDVDYLLDVWDVIDEELQQTGKDEWAAEEFEEVRLREPKPPLAEPWRKLHGLSKLRGRRNYSVAREFWTVRDEFARATDTAPGRLVPDRSVVAAIAANPRTKAQLAGLKEFQGRASRTELDRWWQAFVDGREREDLPAERVPSDNLPPVKAWAHKRPEADARLKAAKPAVEAHAEFLAMPTENLLTPEHLRRVAWQPPTEITEATINAALRSQGARAWQAAQTAPLVSRAFVRAAQSPDEATDRDS